MVNGSSAAARAEMTSPTPGTWRDPANWTVVGTLYGPLYRRRNWRDDPRLRQLFLLATFGWSAVFVVRAGVQTLLTGRTSPACSR